MKKSTSVSGRRLYSDNLVRQLCTDIISKQDPMRVEELILLLRAVLRDDQEEIRTRMTFIAKRFLLAA